ncbi:MAG TPA: guanylate kinase [Acidimicrobiales bacterium]|nr:guanylate kinase [Acidimicrobiales bacterium]
MLSGPGGAGKGTVIRQLLSSVEGLWLSRSWTTRAPRPGEALDAYEFVTREAFEERIAEGGFLEWAMNVGEYYGTPIPNPPAGFDVVLEIDVQGAKQVLERCDDVVCVFLVPPTKEDQAARLRARGDSEDHIAKRLALGEWEAVQAAEIGATFVVNDEVDRATGELAAIIDQARRSGAPAVGES